jgi:hypothetical protein
MLTAFRWVPLLTCGLIGCLISGLITRAPAQSGIVEQMKFLGQATLKTGLIYRKTEVGGLSGITYDPRNKVYYSISDDRSQKAPARFYTLRIDLDQGLLKPKGVKVTKVTTLLDTNQQPFPAKSLDPEGIAVTKRSNVWITSEGDADRLIAPFIRVFGLAGESLSALDIPKRYLPTADKRQGIRNNLAFESLTLTPDGQQLFTATENALYQDGPVASYKEGSPCRILRYNLNLPTQQLEGEFLYQTEAIAVPADRVKISAMNGLSELLALDNQGHLLSLERAFVPDLGFTIRLFEVSLQNADNLLKIDSLSGTDISKIKPAQKRLLADLRSLKIPLDNLEGMTLGPMLPDGRQTLIMVSDNNFSPLQVTQFLAFGLRMSKN